MKLQNAYHLAEYGAAKCALLNLQQPRSRSEIR